jgi:hypothetical protein
VDFGWLAHFFKLPTRVCAAALIVAGALLFLPGTWLASIGLDSLVAQYRPVIGITFLASVAFLLVDIGRFAWAHVTAHRQQQASLDQQKLIDERDNQRMAEQRAAALKIRNDHLLRLTKDEKEILRPFVANNVRSRSVLESATLDALAACEVINIPPVQALQFDRQGGGHMVEVYVQPWALDYLKEHPELLKDAH